MKPQDHEKLLMQNITKTYQKAADKLENATWKLKTRQVI